MSVIGASPLRSNARCPSSPGIADGDLLAGAEAVGAVPVARVDPHARRAFAGITLRSRASRRAVGVVTSCCV